jgi:hypothetical protein
LREDTTAHAVAEKASRQGRRLNGRKLSGGKGANPTAGSGPMARKMRRVIVGLSYEPIVQAAPDRLLHKLLPKAANPT